MDAESLSFLWKAKPRCMGQVWREYIRHVWICLDNPGRITMNELRKLRALFPDFAFMAPVEVRRKVIAQMGTSNVYDLGEWRSREGRYLAEQAKILGLNVNQKVACLQYLRTWHPDGREGPLVDEPELVEYVLQRMRDADCTIDYIECD